MDKHSLLANHYSEMSNGTASLVLCLNFTTPYLKVAVYGRAAAGTVACFVCIATVVLITVLKSYHLFVHRLTLYLAIAGFWFALLLALQGLPVNLDSDVVSLRPGWETVCVVIGFLAQYTGWVHISVMSWISLYAVNLLKNIRNEMGRKCEIACVVVSAVLPLFISLVPFVHNMYGLAGAWCWIKVNRGQSCNETSIGVGYQIGLFYAPVILLAILSLSVSSVTFGSFLKNACARHLPVNRQLQGELVKGALALLIYPMAYLLFGTGSTTW